MSAKREPTRSDKYAEIADSIREVGKDVYDTISKVLDELDKSNSAQVLMSCKKYIEKRGLYLTDYGTVGIPPSFLDGHYAPYDIVLYGHPSSLKTNDLVLVYSHDEKNVIMTFHMKVIGFVSGHFEVEYLDTRKRVIISNSYIIAKMVKVIPFGSALWHELIYELITQSDLNNSLQRLIDETEKQPDYPLKAHDLQELKRRFAILSSGTS